MITYETTIYYDYTDAMGVVYYANYLKFCEKAKQNFFINNGCDLFKLHKDGVFLPVRHIKGEFIKSVWFGEHIKVNTTIKEIKKVSITLNFDIMVNNELKVNFEILLACVDKFSKIVKLPECILKLK